MTFKVCSLKRLKLEALNCQKKRGFNLYDCRKNTDSVLGPTQEDTGFHLVFSSIFLSKLSRAYQESPDTDENVWVISIPTQQN